MDMTQLTVPSGWEELTKDDRSSTISQFVTGAKRSDGEEEVDIWRGVEREDGVHLDSHLGNEIPDNAKFIIEIHSADELLREEFAETKDEAIEKANKHIRL